MTEQPPAGDEPRSDAAPSSFGAGLRSGGAGDPGDSSGSEDQASETSSAPKRRRRSRSAETRSSGDGDAEDAPPARKKKRAPRRRKAATADSADAESRDDRDADGRDADDGAADEGRTERKAGRARDRSRRRGSKRASSDDEPTDEPERDGEDAPERDSADADDDGTARKRRRRGSRGGRRRKRQDEAAEVDGIPGEESDDLPEPESERDADDGDGESEGGGKKRRRRRSRRRGRGGDDEDDEAEDDVAAEADDDERPSRKKRSKAKAKTKTRAKAPTKTTEEKAAEAEALRVYTIAVNAVEPEERRVAVFKDDRIVDFLMNAESQKTLVNDVYRGRVVNLEPAIGAAFIDFGQGRNGFLHTSDVMPIYGEKGFKLEDLLTAGIHHEEGDHDADWSETEDVDEDDFDDGDEDVEASDSDAEEDEDASPSDDPGDDEDDDAEHGSRARLDDVADDDDHDGDDGARRVVRSRRRPSAPYEVDGDSDAPSDDGGDAPKRKRSRSRRTSREDDAGDGEAPTRKKRSSRKKASASDAEDSSDGDEAPVRKRKASKKSTARRSKKKATREDGDNGDDAEAPEKPAKKSSRKKKADSKEKTRKEPAKKAGEKSRKKASKKKASSRSPKGSAGKGQKKRGARTGRRGGRGERRPQREQRPIDELLRVGDSVVVQVTKDAIGDKGPTLTTYVSMPGRYLVLMPSMARTGVSRKIPDDKERKRLKRILASVDTPKDMGVIVRTAGVGRTKTDLKRDLDYLMGLWDSFGKKLKSSRGPSPLYLESDVATRTLRDLFNRETKEVVVDDFTVYEQMVNFAEALMPEHVGRIKRYEGGKPLFQHHGIEPDFERIFARRVDLPSGGSIVFDQAEALVAIDVNSGRTRTDSRDFEDIALKTNLEAVPEIARQIKLRDLGGIIVCDFIDMMRSTNNRKVEKSLREALSSDRARSKLGRISQFGLLEMTRQRLGPGTHKKVFQACPRCRGTGRIRTVESRAQAILRRLGGAVIQKGFSKVEVRAHPEVVDYLKEELWDWVRALEHRSEKEIDLTPVPEQPEDSVLRYLRADGREVRPGGRRKR